MLVVISLYPTGPDDGSVHAADQFRAAEPRVRRGLHQVSNLLCPPRGQGQDVVLLQGGLQGTHVSSFVHSFASKHLNKSDTQLLNKIC